ncbi:IS200/IS605 family transposase [Acaryochloris sp. CCMEE 5410]|uniref:IS200/IS605 family transposase n=1 Tax=Acaryochloris sp. CCMEE 5410 TaxID=310037 RepID=UPI0002484D16|nr:IS200/IS605 family transposase [Acaryochloris sp. CCMEE 5410]KAI9135546.1 IS200/IS605 family transposase [Acaryochloris sp. CCMEE 5410]
MSPKKLNHTTWDCKYHIVFIPKRRRKVIYGSLRIRLGVLFRELAEQRGVEILEGHLLPDHVHMCMSIPPKHPVSGVVGFMKGKSAIAIARQFMGKRRNYSGESFWAHGYYVSTVGLDEGVVRAYIRNQEIEDERIEQLNLPMS